MASLQREIQGYRQTLGMTPGQGLIPAPGQGLGTEEDEEEEENDDDEELEEGNVGAERLHGAHGPRTRTQEVEKGEEEDEEDDEEDGDCSGPTQGQPNIQQQRQQPQPERHITSSSSSSAAVVTSGRDSGHGLSPNEESSSQQQLVRALMDQLQRVQAEAQAQGLGSAEGQGLAELTHRLRRAEARSIALDQQIQSMPPSLQVAQAEKRVSEARLQSALLACQHSLSSHTQCFESQRAEWRAMMTLKEEERRRLSAKVLSMKETVHQLTHHLHALQSQARAREELDQEAARMTAQLGGRGPGLGQESSSDSRLLAAEVRKEREKLMPAPWAHALAPGQGPAQPQGMVAGSTSTAITATTFTASADVYVPMTATKTTAATTMFTPTLTPSYQYVNNTATAGDGDTPATVVPSYFRYNNLPNNNNNDDNNGPHDLMGGVAMAALDHSLLSNTTTDNNHTTNDNDGNDDGDGRDRVIKASSHDNNDTKGDKLPLSADNNNSIKGTLKKKAKGKG